MKRPELPGGWTLWPQVLVRGAGFELARLDALRGGDPSGTLREVARDPLFREAVAWQNRGAVVDGLDSLLRKPPGATDSRTRKKERLVARYLQRYAAKCDTIGFFGPVGWGRWSEGAGRFKAGPLIEARATCFEPWAMRAVMDATRGRAKLTFPPQLKITRRGVEAPEGIYVPTRAEWAVIRRVARGPVSPARLPKAIVAHLVSQGVLLQRHRVSIAHQPVRPAPRKFEQLRGKVAEAAGDAEELIAALGTLEAAFTKTTSHAAKRREGKTYAGRGLVYEECRRGVRLEAGPAVLADVAEPLAVLLQVSRWYSFTVARYFASALLELSKGKKDFGELWRWADVLFEKPRHVHRAAKELSKRWNALFAGAQTLEPGVALERAAKLFKAPCPGWPGARHHAPDLMFAAADAEAMLRGEGQAVLAELHPGVNPFTTLSVLSLCPDRKALEREWARDFPVAGISPVPWEDFARSSQDARLAKEHFHLEEGGDFDSERPPSQRLRLADVTLVKKKGRLLAECGQRTFDALELFERRVRLQATTEFSLSEPGAHVGRRFIGKLLVQRETWRFEKVELPEDVETWRAGHGMPERVFVRIPTETKPIYVDFKAPPLVDNLRHMLKGAPSFTVQEMFPAADGLWLRDGDGKRYVSELRMLAVDPVAFDGALVWGQARR